MEQVTRIGLASQPWQGRILPLNHTCKIYKWRVQSDLNQRSGSCSPTPYHLAIDPNTDKLYQNFNYIAIQKFNFFKKKNTIILINYILNITNYSSFNIAASSFVLLIKSYIIISFDIPITSSAYLLFFSIYSVLIVASALSNLPSSFELL